MKTALETNRLILRSFTENDFAAVQSWASDSENVRLMLWGPNTEEETKKFIDNAKSGKDFAVVLKKPVRLLVRAASTLILQMIPPKLVGFCIKTTNKMDTAPNLAVN